MQVLWSTRCWTRLEDRRWRGEDSGAPTEVVIEVLSAGLCVEFITFGHWPWLRDNECISCGSSPRKVKRARNATSDSGYGQTSIGRMINHWSILCVHQFRYPNISPNLLLMASPSSSLCRIFLTVSFHLFVWLLFNLTSLVFHTPLPCLLSQTYCSLTKLKTWPLVCLRFSVIGE